MLAQAQDQSQPAASQDAGAGGAGSSDIVVTALKRSTNLQQTPLSISAVTEQTLTHLGATSINDYFQQVPNLQIEGNSPTSRRITIRGVRSAGESTVGLYYDETPLTGPNGTTQDAASTNPDVNLFDVERVEVLRGPQGTLYGSGSMGGTVRVIYNKANTRRVEGAVEGQMTATKDGSPGFYMKGMINLPLVEDKLAVRLVAYNEERGGFVDDVALGRKNINSSRSYGGRAMVTFTPTERLTVYGSATYQKTELDGQSGWYQRLGENSYDTDARAIARTNDELKLFNVTAKYDLDFATITLTSSHYLWNLLRNADYTPTLQASRQNATACRNYFSQTTACTADELATFGAYADSRLPGLLYQPMKLNSWNNEARISGSLFDKFVDYTVGFYYEKRKDRIDSQVVLANSATGEPITPLDYTAWRYVTTDERQTAIFGELTLHPTTKFSLTAGLRHFDYKKIVAGQVLISNYITQSYVGPYNSVDASAKGWVSKFSANYQFTPDFMVFASAAKGFRPGGANNIPGLNTGLLAYSPDSLWDYEIGFKSQWFDHKLTLNATVYQIDWSNLQVSATSANGAFSYLTNAGKARIRGAEAEITLRPVTGLTFTSGLGYVDARLTQDQANSAILITGSTGLDGDRFPNVPQFTASFSAQYEFPLSDAVNGIVRGDFTHTGQSASQFRPTYVYYDIQPAYQQVNLRAGAEWDNGFSAYVFANNVFNAIGPTSVTSSIGSNDMINSLTPRTIGLMMRKTF
ncbi:MAG: TonB-dependent receptor [Sphingomonas bacterium]